MFDAEGVDVLELRGRIQERGKAQASGALLFREVNERIAELTGSAAVDVGLFICECSSDACAETVDVSPAEYEAVRAHGDRFVVLAGHEDRDRERVVDGNGRFLVVEKVGSGGHAARELDPRRQ